MEPPVDKNPEGVSLYNVVDNMAGFSSTFRKREYSLLSRKLLQYSLEQSRFIDWHSLLSLLNQHFVHYESGKPCHKSFELLDLPRCHHAQALPLDLLEFVRDLARRGAFVIK
jgi:hypothetical protein